MLKLYQLSLDLVRDWLLENEDSIFSRDVSGIATYQPFDGLMELKVAVAGFMSEVMDKLVLFNPSQTVLTAGAASTIEMLSFCLADAGNAFLVPSPYYPVSTKVHIHTYISDGTSNGENAAKLLKIAWMTLLLGVVISIAACVFVFWLQDLSYSNPYAQAILIHGFACMLELLAEPLYILAYYL